MHIHLSRQSFCISSLMLFASLFLYNYTTGFDLFLISSVLVIIYFHAWNMLSLEIKIIKY